MKMVTHTKVEISMSAEEHNEVLRKYYGLPEGSEIVFSLVEDPSNDKILVNNDKWIPVPDSWFEEKCPTFIPKETVIEVTYRDGSTDSGVQACWVESWSQDGTSVDIIAYRVK